MQKGFTFNLILHPVKPILHINVFLHSEFCIHVYMYGYKKTSHNSSVCLDETVVVALLFVCCCCFFRSLPE